MKQKNHDKISIISRIENSNNKYGWAVLGLYIAALAIISYFHEPWFDEAQSWLIARDMSVKDILFFMPHYEGHPPLWHLYLVPFAKLGVPYELGLNLAAIILNGLAIGLFIFKAPFKKIIKYTIPFTYYFFYLYGVLSRCYSLTLLGFVLLAITFKDRNIKPFKYILSMMLICASTAYGIVLCGGIAIVWLIEIIKENKTKGFVKRIVRDKRFWALLILLAFAAALIFLIIPKEDTYAANLPNYSTSLVERLFYMLILAPAEATIFTSTPGNYILMFAKIETYAYITGTLLSALLFSYFYIIGRNKKTLKLLILPYILFAFFCANVYFAAHHISVIAYFFIFWLWISCENDMDIEMPKAISGYPAAKRLFSIFPAILILFGLYWNIGASIIDINENYFSSKSTAEFIIENNLDELNILVEWRTYADEQGDKTININDQASPATLAYFDENIFYAFNKGNKEIAYNTHIMPSQSDTQQEFERWREIGVPDVLIGYPDLHAVFDGDITIQNYTLVKVIYEKRITKADFMRFGSISPIFVRNDLLDEYGFEALDMEYLNDVLLGKIKPD